MHEHAEILNVLLSHCQGLLDPAAVEANDGFQVYSIDLPGLLFIVEAKRTSKIGYTYIIRFYDRRFKSYTSTPRTDALASIIPSTAVAVAPPASSVVPKPKLPNPIPRSSVIIGAVAVKKTRAKRT